MMCDRTLKSQEEIIVETKKAYNYNSNENKAVVWMELFKFY